jgi:hypothetical protein
VKVLLSEEKVVVKYTTLGQLINDYFEPLTREGDVANTVRQAAVDIQVRQCTPQPEVEQRVQGWEQQSI